MASIIVVKGLSKGDYYPLREAPLTMGRGSDVDGQIIDDNASRRHVRFEWDKDARLHRVVDLDSRNGTRINGTPVTGSALLKDGDVVEIGQTQARFTTADFPNRESAMSHVMERRWFGEDLKGTMVG